jgi:hypothetical protein
MDEIKIKIKMLVGLNWCQTYALGSEIWKKMKKKGRSEMDTPTFLIPSLPRTS